MLAVVCDGKERLCCTFRRHSNTNEPNACVQNAHEQKGLLVHSSFACEVNRFTVWREGARVSDIGSIGDSAKFNVHLTLSRLSHASALEVRNVTASSYTQPKHPSRQLYSLRLVSVRTLSTMKSRWKQESCRLERTGG